MFLFADLFVFQRCPGQSVRNGVQHRFQQTCHSGKLCGRETVDQVVYVLTRVDHHMFSVRAEGRFRAAG
jgi:hypothetical protein